MKRWMVRLAALSTVVLVGLLLFAHATRKSVETTQVKPDKAATQAPEAAVTPIPLIGEEDPAEPASSDPFAGRSRLMDRAAEPPAVDRYGVTVSKPPSDRYSEIPDDEPAPLARYEEATSEEPQRLDVPDDAQEISATGNPFANRQAVAASAEEPVAEPQFDESEEGAATAALLEEPLEEELPEEQPTTAQPAARYPSRAPVRPALEDEAPAANVAGERYDARNEVDAFAPPANAERADGARSAATGRPGDRKLEGTQAPSLAIIKEAPPEIQVGQPATLVVRVKNVGQVAAHDVEIHDEVPRGAELLGTKPIAAQEEGRLVWQLGTIKPGDERAVEMQITPRTEGEMGSVASVTFRAAASVRTVATQPKLRLEATAPAKVLIGEQAALRIRISNPGTGAATGVVLTEEVPAGFKHEGGSELEFEVGTLAPGESRELELVLLAAQPGVVTNLLRAEADTGLSVQEQDEIEVVAPALKVSINGPSKRYLQRNATHTIAITNPGTASAKNVELTTALPRGLKFVEANNEGQYDPTAHAVIWSLEELPPGESGEVTLTTLAVEAGDQRLQVVGKAAMGLEDSLEEEVVVEGVAAIFFELVDVNDPIEIGGETTYEIRVINQGSAAATNVRLAALLPPEMKALEADGPVSHTIEADRVLFDTLGQLAPKADTMYTVKVKASGAGDLRLRIQLVTDEITTPVTKEESTRVYSDE